jgi:HEAT repeat protein
MTERPWRTLAAAGHAGDEVAARAALADVDPVSRQLALGALERIGRLTDDDVRAALGDAEHAVRRRATLLAAGRPEVDLLAVLDDTNPTVVEAAAFACGERASVDAPTFSRLVALAGGSDDALVREAAVAALGALGDERALPVILAACSDKPAVRRRAVLALAPFEGAEVDAALQAALEDRDWQVRQSAEDVLRAGGSDGGR